MNIRAAIYIRVSSEKQGEKVSPQAQEADCREYCHQQGYSVVEVYRDIERYRVGRRLVEPTGTRADRVGLKRLLADGHNQYFDVIVAWREDRLYRGYRPMLDVLDCIDETGIDIELVKETFDKRIAPVKAWAARMELDAKHDRFMMGVAGRLAQGKAWNGGTPYGYEVVDDQFVIDEAESIWVQRMWQWFGDGESGISIRRKLVVGNAPQRNEVKNPWHIQQIYHMLKKEYYHQGFITRKWDGEVYEIPMPPIIDAFVAQKVQDRFARYKRYPSGNLKAKTLAAGLIYCKACKARMRVKSNKDSVYYQCACIDRFGERLEGCASTRSIRILDAELWDKL